MSQLDELVTAVAARVADATVSFKAGKLEINRHSQLRKVVFTRNSGALKPSAAPGRQPFGVPVSGAGTTEFRRFTREELVTVVLRAEDEEALDALFDSVVNAIFEIGGPNVYEEANDYEWTGEDSTNAGKHVSRQLELVFRFRMRLACHPRALPYAVVASTQATITELSEQVIVGGTAQESALSVVSAWLRCSQTSGEVSAVPDVLNADHPAMQPVVVRRPDARADSALIFASEDVLVWPLIPEINGSRKWGCAFWVQHTATATDQTYISIFNLTNGASTQKVEFMRRTAGTLRVDLYVNGANGRRFDSVQTISAAGLHFLTLEVDCDENLEPDQVIVTADQVPFTLNGVNLGAGASLSSGLAVPTGNACLGNRRDTSIGSGQLQGFLARNFFVLGDKMAGAQGLLTAPARLSLAALEPLV